MPTDSPHDSGDAARALSLREAEPRTSPRGYAPAETPFNQTGTNVGVVAIYAVTIDLVFYALCELLPARDAVRLCRTCRDLACVLAARRRHVCSAAPARLIAKYDLRDVLETRWRRFGLASPDLDEALAGACVGDKTALARWILTLPGVAPRPDAVDAALVQLAEGVSLDYDFFRWFVGECPQRPSRKAISEAFAVACGRGKLGFAQAALHAAVVSGMRPLDQQDLVLEAHAAALEGACHQHVVKWTAGRLRTLEERYA